MSQGWGSSFALCLAPSASNWGFSLPSRAAQMCLPLALCAPRHWFLQAWHWLHSELRGAPTPGTELFTLGPCPWAEPGWRHPQGPGRSSSHSGFPWPVCTLAHLLPALPRAGIPGWLQSLSIPPKPCLQEGGVRARGDGWEGRAGPRLGEPPAEHGLGERGPLLVVRPQDCLLVPVTAQSHGAAPGRSQDPLRWGFAPGTGRTAVGGTGNGGCGRRDSALPVAAASHRPFIEADFWAEPNGPSPMGRACQAPLPEWL